MNIMKIKIAGINILISMLLFCSLIPVASSNLEDYNFEDNHDGTAGEYLPGFDNAKKIKEHPIILPTAYLPHSPIRINDNSGFNTSNGVMGGDGSANTPYIISGWQINALGYGCGIYVGNTTDHFRIRDCYVHNASGNSGVGYYNANILLNNSDNGGVENCTVENASGNGIYLISGNPQNFIIKNNTIKSNGENGIFSNNGRYNFFENNTIYDVPDFYQAIYLFNCWQETVKNNTIYNSGLGLYAGYNNHIITGNKVNGKPVYYYSDTNDFSVPTNIGQLILANCNDTTIRDLRIDNTSRPIIMAFCTNITIENCTLSDSREMGIFIHGGYRCNIINNTIIAENHNTHGIYGTLNGQNYFISNNKLIDLNIGIFLMSFSTDNEISFNNFSKNQNAINLSSVDLINITKNTIVDGNGPCIYLSSVNRGTLINNTIINNTGHGAFLFNSDSNTIIYNTFQDCLGYGVFCANGADDNLIHHNNFLNNRGGGIQGSDVTGTNFWNNTENRGNYWSDYEGLYPTASNDGYIWNISYDVEGAGNVNDSYPLVYLVEFDAPVINDVSINEGYTGNSYTFKCNITEVTNITNVAVFYWFGDNILSAINTSMSYNSVTELWEYTIIQLPTNNLDQLKFNVSAVDVNLNWGDTGLIIKPIFDDDEPNAQAGANQEKLMGDKVTFDGTGSWDNIEIINYTWKFFYGSAEVKLYGATPGFVFKIAGDYLVTLKVFDDAGNNDTDTLWVNISDLEKPKITIVSYPYNVYIAQNIVVYVNVYDASGIDQVKINYIDVDGNLFNMSMTNIIGNDWNYVIPAQPKEGVVSFYIWVSDSFANWNKTNTHYLDVLDNILPEVSEVVSPIKVEVGQSIVITTKVNDNSGISEVKLNYTGSNFSTYNISMVVSSGLNYTFTIPGQVQEGVVTFYIWVVDVNNNDNRSINKTIQVFKPIKEVTKPKFIFISAPIQAKVGEQISVLVTVMDEYGIDRVNLNYTDVNGFNYNESMEFVGNNNYTYTIPGQDKGGEINWFIAANNTHGIWNKTSYYVILIFTPPPDDVFPPEVISTTPTDGSVGIKIDVTITIIFNESMNPTNVTSAFSISPPVAHEYSWKDNNIILKIILLENLSYNTNYTVNIGAGATDIADNHLKPFALTFTTEQAPEPDKDLDNDLILDDWELANGLNPNDPNDAALDNDNDGLTNLQEYNMGTNLSNSDSDADGMTDGWEVTYGLNPLVNDSFDDIDGDNFNNLEEFKAGTIPTDSASVPEKDEDDKDEKDVMTTIAAIIIVLIVIIILLALLMRKAGKEKEEGELAEETIEDEEGELSEEDLENISVDGEVPPDDLSPEELEDETELETKNEPKE